MDGRTDNWNAAHALSVIAKSVSVPVDVMMSLDARGIHYLSDVNSPAYQSM